jgi:hypothetical protein
MVYDFHGKIHYLNIWFFSIGNAICSKQITSRNTRSNKCHVLKGEALLTPVFSGNQGGSVLYCNIPEFRKPTSTELGESLNLLRCNSCL